MYFGFRNLSVSYGKKEVLRSLDVDVPRGKVVTVIGQNGCGKSTMLKTVSKAVTPKRGEVVFCDRRLGEYAPKKLAQQIAYLSQVHESPPDIDVRTLVSYGRYPYSKFGRGLTQADADIIDRALALTGLTALEDRILSTLSGGERQRAWIAMTIAQEPEILILDEPTTYLDVSYQVEVLELIKKLNRELGITIIMVLHDINLAARYSDVLMAVKGGRLYAAGTPAEIVTKSICRKSLRSKRRFIRTRSISVRILSRSAPPSMKRKHNSIYDIRRKNL